MPLFWSVFKFFLRQSKVLFGCKKPWRNLKRFGFVLLSFFKNTHVMFWFLCSLEQTKTFRFCSDYKRTKSKPFGFVPIISFDIETFVLSFLYRWHYLCSASNNIVSPYIQHILNDDFEMDCDFPLCILAPAHVFQSFSHRVHIFTRDETGSVYLPTQLERTLQLHRWW